MIKKLFSESWRVINVKNLTWSIALHFFQSSVFQIMAYQFPRWLSHKPLNLKRCFNKVWSSGLASAIRFGLTPRVRPPEIKPIAKPTDSNTASLAEARLRSVRASRVSRPWIVLAWAQRFRPALVLGPVLRLFWNALGFDCQFKISIWTAQVQRNPFQEAITEYRTASYLPR
jgi:hypothetical protein